MKYVICFITAIVFLMLVAHYTKLDEEILNGEVGVLVPGVGKIIGNYCCTAWTRQSYIQFLGIPYAESPRGKLRFKAPNPRKPWREPFNATKYGRRCPVITNILKLNQNELQEDLEDCLSLCVYTKCLSCKWPVMFYVHGGGFNNGSSADYPPRFLLEKDIVLVVPQYRIGALGWLSTRTPDMPGNAGIADLILALRWVNDNIAVFGGNNRKITVFGQSSGAALVGALLLSPKAPSDIIKRAIMQSGSILSSWAINQNPYAQAEYICKAVGCWSCGSSCKIYKCLKDISVESLIKHSALEFYSPITGDLYGILPRAPLELLKSYNHSINVMLGFTKHDGSFLVAMYYDEFKKRYPDMRRIKVRQFASGLIKKNNEDMVLAKNILFNYLFKETLLRGYEHKDALPAYFDLASILYIKSPMVSLATQLSEKHLGLVYFYTFDYKGQHTRFGYEFGTQHYPFYGGVHHSDDNIYLFSTHKFNWPDTQMAKTMVALWTNFARDGVPKSKHVRPMLPMKTENGPFFHIDKKITIGSSILNEFKAAINDLENRKLIKKHTEF